MSIRPSWLRWLFLSGTLLSSSGTIAQEDASLALQGGELTNPLTSAEDIAAGARVFRTSCALCHGGDAKGGRGPDLTRGVFRRGSSDGALFRNIRGGIRGSDMPGVYRPDTDIWQVVAYVRSLSEGAEQVVIPGDPARGERLYQTRGGCPDCHRIASRGGRLGPDLSDVGWLRSPGHLEAALLRPSEVLRSGYRTVIVSLREDSEGREVRGILLNEDTYSIQLLDENENLRSFDKRDLVGVGKPEESLMPSLEGFFGARELEHLIAYLYSLKGHSLKGTR